MSERRVQTQHGEADGNRQVRLCDPERSKFDSIKQPTHRQESGQIEEVDQGVAAKQGLKVYVILC